MEINLHNILMTVSRHTLYLFLLQVLCMQFVLADSVSGQSIKKVKVSLDMKDASLSEIFAEIEHNTDFVFAYDQKVSRLPDKLTLNYKKTVLANILEDIATQSNLRFRQINNTISVKKHNRRTAAVSRSPEKSRIVLLPVTGQVTTADGAPLPGVNIIVKGTTLGTISDIDGYYKVEIPEGSTLVFSFIGYETTEIIFREQAIINVTLQEDVQGLEEVVVVGYGTSNRKDLTGSISSVAPKVLEDNTFGDIGAALQGQISGVNILTGDGSPGEPVQINIRGVTSLLGNTSPLIVVDEVPMPSEFNLNDLNPQNIESIDVLKGASSAAIYGSRAASGVVIIKTKAGKLGAKPQINYSYNFGIDQLTSDINVLSAEEWKYMVFEGIKNAAVYNGFSDVKSFIQYDKFITPGYFGEYNTNWMEEMLQNSHFQQHNLSITGGSQDSKYAASLGYLNDDGMMRSSGFDRYNVNLSLSSQLSDRLQFGISFRGNLSKREIATGTLADAIRGRPDIRAYNEDGSIFLNTYELGDGRLNLIESPLARLLDNKNLAESHNISTSGYLAFEIFNGLNFKSRFNYYDYAATQKQYYASTTSAGSGFAFAKMGTLDDTDNSTRQTEWENSLNYRKSIGDHDFDVVLATSYLTEDREGTTISFDNFPDDKVQTEIYHGATFRGATGYHNDAYMMSYISRLNYKWKDRYLLTASFRRDGSSKFSSENAYGNFPALAVGWIASEENFLSGVGWLDLLKLRVSTGKTGMADVGYYRWRTTYEATSYNGQPAVIPDQTGNENLKWESTVQKDFGIDFNLFKSRVRGNIVYYIKQTEGLLYPYTMAPSTGYTDATVNFAEIKNSGLDIDLQLNLIRKPNFSWSVGFNYNNNKNIVQKLDKDYITSTDGTQSLRNSIIQEGQPLGLIYGFKTKGIYSSEEQIAADQALNDEEDYQRDMFVGEVRYVDLNGDGFVDMSTASAIGNEDRVVIGKSLPKFSGGFNTSLNYKNWALNIFATYSYGNDKVWVNELWNFGTSQTQPGNVWRTSLNRWTPDNPDAPYPSFRLSRSFPSREFNDFSVYDASFLKIQNIHLEYNFPINIIEKMKIIGALRLYVSVNNVHVFTKYPGPNPESYARGDVIEGAAMDYSSYPQSRTYNLGLKVNFK